MSIKEVVKEKYGQASTARRFGQRRRLLRVCSVILLFHGPDHLESV